MTPPVHTLQTRKRMNQTFVLLLSCCFCINALPLPVPVPAELHRSSAGVAPRGEELQHYEHKRHAPDVVLRTESKEEVSPVLYEGDIIIPDVPALDTTSRQLSGKSKRAVTNATELRWENATVPYKFDTNFPTAAKKKVLRAINHWHKKTCIRFVPRSDETEYIKFRLGSVCASFVGRIPSRYSPNYDGQSVVLTEKCVEKRGNIIHELGHAIGFWHEHTRPDRDDYIEILWDNVDGNHTDDFNKRPEDQIDSLGVPYDLNSIMHYSEFAFSKDKTKPTIRVLDSTFTGYLGQRDHLSDYDIRQANLFYSCNIDAVTNNEEMELEALNVIRTGQEIALKAVTENTRHLWMNCTDDVCRLDGCPGNRFKPEKRQSCTDHIYSLQKLDCSNGKQAMVGDEVVLRKHSTSSQKSVYCGVSGNCMTSTACEVDGQFDRQACPDQILVLKVPLKENGAFLLHKDNLVLEYADLEGRRDGNQPGNWIGCVETCQRRKCSNGQSTVDGYSHQPNQSVCQQNMFTVYKL